MEPVDDYSGMEKLRWTLVSPHDDLDPARYAGQFRELPEAGRPGDWCRVVVHDELGDMRWTLIAVDPARTTSIFADRPPLADVLEFDTPQSRTLSTSVSARD
jgi:hypothetical protein